MNTATPKSARPAPDPRARAAPSGQTLPTRASRASDFGGRSWTLRPHLTKSSYVYFVTTIRASELPCLGQPSCGGLGKPISRGLSAPSPAGWIIAPFLPRFCGRLGGGPFRTSAEDQPARCRSSRRVHRIPAHRSLRAAHRPAFSRRARKGGGPNLAKSGQPLAATSDFGPPLPGLRLSSVALRPPSSFDRRIPALPIAKSKSGKEKVKKR